MVKGADSVCTDTGEERYPCPDVCSTTVIEAGMAAGIPLSLVCPLSGVCETAWLYAAAEQENGKEDGPDCLNIPAGRNQSGHTLQDSEVQLVNTLIEVVEVDFNILSAYPGR